jgi:hypothetical protein
VLSLLWLQLRRLLYQLLQLLVLQLLLLVQLLLDLAVGRPAALLLLQSLMQFQQQLMQSHLQMQRQV